MKKRWLSLLLCLSFVLALVPTAAMAADDAAAGDTLTPSNLYYNFDGIEATSADPDVTLHKTATTTDGETFTVTLTAEAKQQVQLDTPEVTFVLDASMSMNEKNGASTRWNVARQAISTMNEKLGDDVTKHYVYFNRTAGVASDAAYTGVSTNTGTNLIAGVKTGIAAFDTNKKHVLILVSDGEANINDGKWGGSCYPTEEIENFKKEGGIVYTVGFSFDGDSAEFMALATDESCRYLADNAEELDVAMGKITTKVKGLIIDPMGENVELVSDVEVTGEGYDDSDLEVVNNTIYWNNAEGLEKPVTLTYQVKIKQSVLDQVKTAEEGLDVYLNGDATLNYSNDGESVAIAFPKPYVTLNPEPKYFTLHYNSNGGTEFEDESYKDGTELTITNVPTKDGYIFKGWYEDEELETQVTKVIMDAEKTVYAKWAKEYTLTYESNGGTEYQPDKYEAGTEVPMSKIPKKDGYTFAGWYTDSELTQNVTKVTMNSDITVYAKWKADETPVLEKGDHSAYIVGCDDGLVCPEKKLTRAEVAAIFYRLLTDEARETYYSDTNSYSDVNAGDWYNIHISTLTNMKILSGCGDGTFHPNDPVTRAEFASIAARFSEGTADEYADFNDVPKTHWASKHIAKAAKLGWISGDGNGNFRPQAYITRAEAMSLVNRVLERGVDEEGICEGTIQWPDNADTSAWYYYIVQEATNSHEYARTDRAIENRDFCYEEWTQLKPNRKW